MKDCQLQLFAGAALALVAVGVAPAQATVWPQSLGPMEHATVSWNAAAQAIEVAEDVTGPLALVGDGQAHTPPADVLDGKAYNNQPGFAKGNAFAPPTGTGVWVEVLAISDGLSTYAGGMRSEAMVPMHTFAPILSAAGERWLWSGTMHHPWYAAVDPGDYAVTYRVFIGDEVTGEPVSPYGSDTTQFTFHLAPEPGSLALLGAALPLLRRRGRR